MATVSFGRRSIVFFAWIVLLVSTGSPLAGQERGDIPRRGAEADTDTWLQVSSITRSGPPRVFDDLIVLSYQSTRFVRYVAAAFAHEGYQELHVFSARSLADGSDLFYLPYPVDPGQDALEYRIVVDGVWMVDPHAPEVIRDGRGVAIGRVALREPPPYEVTSPRINADGTATFRFAFDSRIAATLETTDQQQLTMDAFDSPRISLVGTFNGWDPFAHRLSGPDPEGFYTTTIPVDPGEHYYYFLIDGRRILDPLNRDHGRDLQTGARLSRFVADPAASSPVSYARR
jgi:hypothetical protein